MKRTKTLIVALLLASFLLSSCGQAFPQAAEAAPKAAASVQQAPEYQAQPLAAQSAAPRSPLADSADKNPVYREKSGLFGAKFEGNAVAGSGEAVDGVYRFSATETDGEAWHVKLESNYPTVAGRDYRVTYRFRSDVAGKVKFGDFQEFEIQEGENSVTGMLIANGGTSYMDLQLGMLPPFNIDFSEIEVEEFADEVDYEDALETPVNFEKEKLVYERHDQGYGTVLDRSADSVVVNYLASSWDSGIWKSKLYVHTGLFPASGTRYRITADLRCDQDMPYELLFNKGDTEKGYGALYGQNLTAGQTGTCEAVITGKGDGDELVLQFSLGEAPEGCAVQVSNLHVEKISDHYSRMLPTGFSLDKTLATGKTLVSLVPLSTVNVPLNTFSYSSVDTVYEGHDDGYVVDLQEGEDSATLNISKAPAEDRGVWKVRLYAATGVEPKVGSTYRVKFDLQSTGDQDEYEVCFDGSSENAYGILYRRRLTAGGTDAVEYLFTPEESRGPLTLRLQLGKTDTTAGNTFKLSNLVVETVEPVNTDVLPASFSYNTGAAEPQEEPDAVSVLPASFDYSSGVNVYEQHADGYEQSVSTDGKSAVLTVSAVPGEGWDLWNGKLFIRTGVTPEAGAHYRVSASVHSDKAIGEYELVCDNGGAENGYADGKLPGLSLSAGASADISTDFVAPSSGCGELVLRFQLGKSPAGNTITVSDLKVCKVTGGGSTAQAGGTENGSFLLEANEGAGAELTGDGSSATARITKSGDDWHVKLYAKPGVKLETGKSYRVSFQVTGANGCQVCYKNTDHTGEGDAETVFGTETVSSDDAAVTHTFTAAEDGTMEILLKIGNLAEGSTVKLSDVKLEAGDSTASDLSLEGFAYPVMTSTLLVENGKEDRNSFTLEANNDTAAEFSGDTASASAKVVKAGDDWHIKLYAKPGVTLEAGKAYRVSFDVTNFDGHDVCFKSLADGVEDPETAFGTEKAADGHVSHQIIPTAEGRTKAGGMEILLKLGDLAEGTTVTVSNVKVEKSVQSTESKLPSDFAYPVMTSTLLVENGKEDRNSFTLEANNDTAAEFSGDTASASAKVVKAGDDWHIKLYAKPGVTLEAGKAYRVSFDVTNFDGHDVCFKSLADGVEDPETAFGTEKAADGHVSHQIIPTAEGRTKAGGMEILLKLGDLAEGTTVTVSNVKVEKATSTASNVTPTLTYPSNAASLRAYKDHPASSGSFALEGNVDTYAILSGSESSATASIVKPGDDWHIKFYAKPGYELQAGKSYRVSFDVTNGQGGKVCYKSGDNEEAFEAEDITSNSQTITHTITPDANSTPEILLKLGTLPAGTDVTVSNFKIEEASEWTNVTPSGFSYPNQAEPIHATPGSNAIIAPYFELEANNSSAADLTGDGSSATATVITKGADWWHIKFYAKPGVTLQAGKNYKVSIDVTNGAGCTVCYKGEAGEEAFGTETVSSNSQTVTHSFTSADGGWMEIMLKIGNVENGTAITVSNVKIEENTLSYTDVTPALTYPTAAAAPRADSATSTREVTSGSFTLEANTKEDSTTAAELSGSGSSAVATVLRPGDDWQIKFYAKPGYELQAGKTYQVSFDVENGNGGKVCYKGGDNEEAFGTEDITSDSQTIVHKIKSDANSTPEILLKLGNLPVNSQVKISNVKLEEVSDSFENVALEGFAYPNITGGSVDKKSFELEAFDGAAAALTGDGSSMATATVTTPGADYHIKYYAKPGMTLEAGKTYRVSFDVTNADGREVCFKNLAEGVEDPETAFGTATVSGGHVSYDITPAAEGRARAGEMQILMKIGDLAADTAVQISNVKLQEVKSEFKPVTLSITYPVTTEDSQEEIPETVGENLMTATLVAWAPVHAFADTGYEAGLTNTASSATLSISAAPESDRADWKLKLFMETGAELKAGKNYRVRYTVQADSPFDYNVFYNGAEEKELGDYYDLKAGDAQTVEHILSPEADAVLTIQLMPGKSAAPNKFTVSKLQVEELPEGSAPAAAHAPINFWAHEDYEASLSNDDSSASLAITKVPETGREAWKVKLFAETGAKLQSGKTYRVSLDVQATTALDYEICYNNVEVEKELGAVYGLSANAEKQTVSYTVAPEKDAELILQLNLGNAAGPNTVTISGIRVEEMALTNPTGVIPSFRYDSVGYISSAADAGYITALERDNTSATFRILQAPAERNPWNAKLYVKTGLVPKTGKGYNVSFDLTSEKSQELFELFFDGNSENTYGALYEQRLPAGTRHFDYTVMPGDSRGELVLQLRPGKTDTTDGNAYTISNLRIDEVTFTTGTAPETKPACELWTLGGYTSHLDKTADRATVRIEKTPTTGLEPWKTKLFVNTGVTLRPDQKYRISMEVKSIIPAPFEVCFNDGDEEKGLGAIYGLIATPAGQYVEYVTYTKEDVQLAIQLSLGNCTAPNSIILSNLKVEKAGTINLVSHTVYTF